jgi:hypothetical protein
VFKQQFPEETCRLCIPTFLKQHSSFLLVKYTKMD